MSNKIQAGTLWTSLLEVAGLNLSGDIDHPDRLFVHFLSTFI
jgi:hypothetical protein